MSVEQQERPVEPTVIIASHQKKQPPYREVSQRGE